MLGNHGDFEYVYAFKFIIASFIKFNSFSFTFLIIFCSYNFLAAEGAAQEALMCVVCVCLSVLAKVLYVVFIQTFLFGIPLILQ